jgi:hypothetical protein
MVMVMLGKCKRKTKSGGEGKGERGREMDGREKDEGRKVERER